MSFFPYEAKLVAVVPIGTVDASATPTVDIFVAPCDCVIKGVGLVCGSQVALATTNSANVTVTNVTDSQVVASLKTKTGEADANAIATDTYEALTLASTASYLELQENDVLQVAFTETTATAGDLVEASMVVKWVPGQGAGQ